MTKQEIIPPGTPIKLNRRQFVGGASAATVVTPAEAFWHGRSSSPSSSKLAVAYYYLFGSPYGYTQADYAQDIVDMQAVGIDGVAIGVGSLDSQYLGWISQLVAAIQASGSTFFFFFSLESSSTATMTVAAYQNIVTTYQGSQPGGGTGVSNSNYYWLNGLPLVTGDNSQSAVSYLTSIYNGSFQASFFPGWYIPNASAAGTVKAGNPVTTDLQSAYAATSSVPQVVGWFYFTFGGLYSPANLLTSEEDYGAYLPTVGLKYMAGVSSYYGEAKFNTDANLAVMEMYGLQGIRQQWTPIIAGTYTPFAVMIDTWSDMTESYTSPAPVASMNLLGFASNSPMKSHIAFAKLHAYFISWWKTGSAPTPVNDQIFVCYRVLPGAATPTSIAISSISWSGGVATATTSSPLNSAYTTTVGATTAYSTGLQWTIAGNSLSGYNGAHICAVTGASTFTFPLASSPGGTGTGGTATCNQTGLFTANLIDQISIVTIATAAGTVQVNNNGTITNTSVASGYVETLVPFVPGSVEIKLIRNGSTVIDIVGAPILASAPYWDFNPQTYYESVSPTPAWYDVMIGGGGQLTSMDISGQTLGTRANSYGAYVGSTTPGAPWTQLVTTTSMPSPIPGDTPFYGQGVGELRIHPSNPAIMIMRFLPVQNTTDGWFWSTNGGATWVLIAPGTGMSADPQIPAPQSGAFDPNNQAAAYLGSYGLGHLQFTSNSGGSVSNISTGVIPAPTTNNTYNICYFPASGTTGGFTSKIMVGVGGVGAYLSTNGGSTWAATSGGPTNIIFSGVSTVDGTYACIDSSGNIWNYLGSTWTQLGNATNPGGRTATGFVWDATTAGKMYYIDGSGYPCSGTGCNTSTATWTYSGGNTSDKVSAAPYGPAWLAGANDPSLNPSGAVIDASGNVWIAGGTAVWRQNIANWEYGSSPPMTWNAQTLGIENLVTNDITWAPGGNPVLACWDRPFWEIVNPNAFPAGYGPDYAAEIRLGSFVDWAKDGSGLIIGGASAANNGAFQGYSNSSGGAYNAWTIWPSQPFSDGTSACGCCVSSTHWVVVDFAGGVCYYTTNAGSSWSVSSGLSGGLNTPFNNLCRHIIVADDTNVGTVYLWTSSGFYSSTNSGASFTNVGTAPGTAAGNYNACMRQVTGKAGHLFYSNGTVGGPTNPHPAISAYSTFYYTTNGGATWTDASNSGFTVREGWCFAFSAAKPGGGGHPAIFFNGWVSTNGGTSYTYGNWQCDNFDTPSTATWYQLGSAFPWGIDQAKIAGGNPSVWGDWIVGYNGSSFRRWGMAGGF